MAIWDMLYRVFSARTWMGARGLNGSQAAAAKMLKVLPNELLAVHLMYFMVLPAIECSNIDSMHAAVAKDGILQQFTRYLQ